MEFLLVLAALSATIAPAVAADAPGGAKQAYKDKRSVWAGRPHNDTLLPEKDLREMPANRTANCLGTPSPQSNNCGLPRRSNGRAGSGPRRRAH
jgi:hypothetical protein